MSTLIDVIPVETLSISFGQVLELSEKHIHAYLKSFSIDRQVKLKINIHDKKEAYVREVKATDLFDWTEDEYAWISIEGIPGGTDVYWHRIEDDWIDPDNPWWMLDDFRKNNTSIVQFDDKLKKAQQLNRYCAFRRSAGQRGIVNISYGLIAAAVAELSAGFLYSGDGAWDYEIFPTESEALLNVYFRPEKAIRPDIAEWSKRCLEGLEEDLPR